MINKMTRERVEGMAAAARDKDTRLDLRDLDLSGLDLSYLDLPYADLRRSNLTRTNFRHSNLSGASFTRAKMNNAYLCGANFYNAYFCEADLGGSIARHANFHGAYLYRTDMRHVKLRHSNLTDVDLHDADLRYASLIGLLASGMPSGNLTFIPTPEGWHLTIGCWEGTTAELRAMIAKDDGWPEAEGEKITARRPMLEAAADMCDAYAAAHTEALAEAKATADRWKDNR